MTENNKPGGNSPARKAVWVIIIIVILGGAGLAMTLGSLSGNEEDSKDPVFSAKQGPLTISVTESGTIQAREQIIIKSEVEGRTTILSLVPEGTRVKKGELLIELDSSSMEDEKVDQQIRVQNAEASFIQARENLEVQKNQAQSDIDEAELKLQFAKEDLKKYQEGEYPKELKEAESKITINEEELQRANETLKWSKILFDEKYISQTELQADELSAKKAQLNLELAREDLALLKNFTYKRKLDELESDVKQSDMALIRTRLKANADIVQAEANKLAKESEFGRQKDKLAKIEDQIKKTKIYAPADGLVVYATSAQGSWRGNAEPLDEGQEVRERQELIYLPTASSFMAEVNIHESSLQKIQLGMPVKITVDALPGKNFTGRVTKIAPLPDAASMWMNPDLKVYNTDIVVDGDSDILKTGMSCRAEIIIERFDNAVYIPVQAVLTINGDSTVFMKNGSKTEQRIVQTGPNNNRMIVIAKGLAPGEEVLLNPPLASASIDTEEAMEADVEGDSAGTKDRQNADVQPAPDRNRRPEEGSRPEKASAENGGAPADNQRPGGNLTPEQREEMRKRFENMTPEQREELRKRFENMSPEDREKMRQQSGGRRGGSSGQSEPGESRP